MSGSGLLPCRLSPEPISLVANSCCNRTIAAVVGVVLTFGKANATTRFYSGNCWLSNFVAARRAGAADLLRVLVPHAATIAILVNPNTSIAEPQKKDVQAAVSTLGLKLHVFEAATESELDNAFSTITRLKVDALVVANDPFFNNQRSKIAALAANYATPAIYEWREYAEAGGLMSYGTIATEVYYQAGIYVGRILKGTQPSTLPVLQPTKFELVINVKAAKALGLEIPHDFLMLADEVIE